MNFDAFGLESCNQCKNLSKSLYDVNKLRKDEFLYFKKKIVDFNLLLDENDTLKSQINQLNSDKDRLTKQLRDTEKENSSFCNDLKNQLSENNLISKECVRLEKSNKKLTSDFKSVSNNCTSLESQIRFFISTIKQFEVEIEELKRSQIEDGKTKSERKNSTKKKSKKDIASEPIHASEILKPPLNSQKTTENIFINSESVDQSFIEDDFSDEDIHTHDTLSKLLSKQTSGLSFEKSYNQIAESTTQVEEATESVDYVINMPCLMDDMPALSTVAEDHFESAKKVNSNTQIDDRMDDDFDYAESSDSSQWENVDYDVSKHKIDDKINNCQLSTKSPESHSNYISKKPSFEIQDRLSDLRISLAILRGNCHSILAAGIF